MLSFPKNFLISFEKVAENPPKQKTVTARMTLNDCTNVLGISLNYTKDSHARSSCAVQIILAVVFEQSLCLGRRFRFLNFFIIKTKHQVYEFRYHFLNFSLDRLSSYAYSYPYSFNIGGHNKQ